MCGSIARAYIWEFPEEAETSDATEGTVSLVPDPSLGRKPLVELAELPQEAIVGADLSLVAHRGHGRAHVHPVAQHQIGDDQRGRAAVALSAVDVHLTWEGQAGEQGVRGARGRGEGRTIDGSHTYINKYMDMYGLKRPGLILNGLKNDAKSTPLGQEACSASQDSQNDKLTLPVSMCQCLLYEVSPLLKVDAQVEVVRVTGGHAVVHHARASVVLCVGVHVHEGDALGGVQDVGDSQALQAHDVHRRRPRDKSHDMGDRKWEAWLVTYCW